MIKRLLSFYDPNSEFIPEWKDATITKPIKRPVAMLPKICGTIICAAGRCHLSDEEIMYLSSQTMVFQIGYESGNPIRIIKNMLKKPIVPPVFSLLFDFGRGLGFSAVDLVDAPAGAGKTPSCVDFDCAFSLGVKAPSR